MTCVKDTLPPRARARWLLMTMRLSISSLTGTDRTLVAVGTARLASMFCAVRAGAPRSTVSVGSSLAVACAGFSGSLGTGLAEVGWAGRASARGLAAAGPVTLGCAAAVPPVGAEVVPFAGADVAPFAGAGDGVEGEACGCAPSELPDAGSAVLVAEPEEDP